MRIFSSAAYVVLTQIAFATSPPCVTLDAVAVRGAPVPGGGTLALIAFGDGATLNDHGAFAFFSKIDGSPRNQGIFVSDGTSLTPIAIGCGDGGGSGQPGTGVGDPSPLGGRFAGFFQGGTFVPSINDAGDVLFMADVDGGSAPRALFLYVAQSNSIVKVAAPGDPTPLGGTFDSVGLGSMNEQRDVAFLARRTPTTESEIFRWSSGVVTKVAAIGDAAPTGGAYTAFNGEAKGGADGSWIPTGPAPSINDAGQIAFRAIASGPVARGIVVVTNGTHAWRAALHAQAPGGGTFYGFESAPTINAAGDVAFLADYTTGTTTTSVAWFVVPGTGPGRRAIAGFEPLDDGALCWGLAISRNPMTPLDDTGNLIVWTDAKLPGSAMEQRLVLCGADGTKTTVVKSSDPTPIGGLLGKQFPFVSLNDVGQACVGAATPGAPTGVTSAHFRADHVVTWLDLGFALAGTNGFATLRGEGSLVAGTSGALRVVNALANTPVFLFVGASTSHVPLFGGTFVPSFGLTPVVLLTDATGDASLSWATFHLPPCTDAYMQVWFADPAAIQGVAASNALRGTTR